MKKVLLIICFISNYLFAQTRAYDPWYPITTDGFGSSFNNKGIYCMKAFKDKLYVGAGAGGSYNGKIFMSATGNQLDWNPVFTTNLDRITVMCNYKDSALFVTGTTTSVVRKIFRTTDGITYKSIADNVDENVSHILSFKGPNSQKDSLYIIKKGGFPDGGYEIYVSAPNHTDSVGYLSIWRKALDFGDTTSINDDAIISAANVINDTLYLSVRRQNNDPVIYKTVDGTHLIYVANAHIGSEFISSSQNYDAITNIETDGQFLYAGTKGQASVAADLWKSSDYGKTWNQVMIYSGFDIVTSINYVYKELWVTCSNPSSLQINRADGTSVSYMGSFGNSNNNGSWGNVEKFDNNLYYGFENNTDGAQLHRLNVCKLSVTTATATQYCQGDSTKLLVGLDSGTAPYSYTWIVDDGANSKDTVNYNSTSDTVAYSYLPLSPGSAYTVSLTVSDNKGCVQSESQFSLIPKPNTDIKGNITYSTNNLSLTSGIVIAYDVVTNDSVGSDLIGAAGDYTISNVPPGDYLILCYPDTSVTGYENLTPTYFGDSFLWENASIVNHVCDSSCTGVDIHMDTLVTNDTNATFTTDISGRLSQRAGFKSASRAPGDPIPGRDVKIGRVPPNGIIASDTTLSDGTFKFRKIEANPLYTYTLYVDMPGYVKDASYTFVLNQNNMNHPRFDSLNYSADADTVWIDSTSWATIGINNISFNKHNAISITPNPSVSETTINFHIHKNTKASLGIYNTMGIQLEQLVNKDFTEGKHTFNFNHKNKYAAGIYYIVLMTDDGKKSITKLIITK